MSTNTHRFHKIGIRNKNNTSYYVDIEAVNIGGTSQSTNKILSLDLAETNSTLKLHGNLGVSSSGQTGSAWNDLDFTLTGDSYITVPTGNITMADIASSQTFTNKTISGSSNTLQNIADSSLSQITTSSKVAGSAIQLASTSAIENSTGLRLKSSLGGTGLTLTNQVLNIDSSQSGITSLGTLTGLTVNASSGTVTISGAALTITAATTHDGNLSVSETFEVGNELLKTEPSGNTVIVSGGLKLGRNIPSTTTEKLYNNSGTLYWDGSEVGSGGGGSGTITALNNQSANRLVTIGSTTTELDGESNMTFDGSNLNITGDSKLTGNVNILGNLEISNDNNDIILNKTGTWPDESTSVSSSAGWHSNLLRFRNGGLNGAPNKPYEWNVFMDNTAKLSFFYNNMGTTSSGNWYGAGSYKAYLAHSGSNNTALNFTGQHRAITNNTNIMDNINNYIGLIVSSTGKISSRIFNEITEKHSMKSNTEAITVNEAIPEVNLSNIINDKKCFGIISNKENDNEEDVEHRIGNFVSVIQTDKNDTRLYINSVGEGAIWVSNINGSIENGDYITTSNIAGYGMKQNDDILHNYTVAKATMDCTFDNTQTDQYETRTVTTDDGTAYIAAFIACTYHCG